VRRKVFQHFANMLPQRFLDLPSGFDLAVCAKHRRGVATFNVLNGQSAIDGAPVADLRTGGEYQAWVVKELESHHIAQSALLSAELTVAFVVEDIQVKESFGHVFRSAHFSFECTSTLRTDEKSYACHREGAKPWGFDPPYWTQLYGAAQAEV
jgi:hypothetical protein